MVQHIHGSLYYERMGRTGPVIAFIQSQPDGPVVLDFSDGAPIDLVSLHCHRHPGYGRSPKADAGLTMTDMAEACWEAIDDALPAEKAILVGCSVGSSLAPHMYHQRPDKTAALVLSGTGYNPKQGIYQGAHR